MSYYYTNECCFHLHPHHVKWGNYVGFYLVGKFDHLFHQVLHKVKASFMTVAPESILTEKKRSQRQKYFRSPWKILTLGTNEIRISRLIMWIKSGHCLFWSDGYSSLVSERSGVHRRESHRICIRVGPQPLTCRVSPRHGPSSTKGSLLSSVYYYPKNLRTKDGSTG